MRCRDKILASGGLIALLLFVVGLVFYGASARRCLSSRLITSRSRSPEPSLTNADTANPQSKVNGAQAMNATNPPIDFRYVQAGEFNSYGYISYGTTFWATNRTTNTLIVSLAAIEVKSGSNWVPFSSPVQPLAFRLRGQALTQMLLKAHEAGYATVQLSPQPTGQVWRARVEVAPVLEGLAAITARLKHYPRIVESRFRLGNTNMPLNPFNPGLKCFGPSTQALSQEIPDE